MGLITSPQNWSPLDGTCSCSPELVRLTGWLAGWLCNALSSLLVKPWKMWMNGMCRCAHGYEHTSITSILTCELDPAISIFLRLESKRKAQSMHENVEPTNFLHLL